MMIQLPNEIVAELLLLLDENDDFLDQLEVLEGGGAFSGKEVSDLRKRIKDLKHRLEDEAKTV